jgi:hypothetical protein
MKIKTSHKIWFYAIAGLAGAFNAYNAYLHHNQDATIAWLIAAGAFFGTASTYHDLKQLEDKQNQ